MTPAWCPVPNGTGHPRPSSDFESRTTAWQSSTCNEALLKSKSPAANNQEVAICYALAKVQAHDGSIASLQSAIATLQANQTPQPVDFTFFNGPVADNDHSPSFDATGFTRVALTGFCNGASTELRIEVSTDGTTWVPSFRRGCENLESELRNVGGRNFRLSVIDPPASQARVIGRFSN